MAPEADHAFDQWAGQAEQPRHDAQQRVYPIHTAVPGRARLHVIGLRQSSDLRDALEDGLHRLSGIETVAASTDTGNVLVYFHRRMRLATVINRISELIEVGATRSEFDNAEADWHECDVAEIAANLVTSPSDGLSETAAQERLVEYGPNAIRAIEPRSAFAIVADQVRTLPVALLGIAAVISFVTGGLLEALAIGALVALNAAIGGTVEIRSERTIGSLASANGGTARVVRDGKVTPIGVESVVPGDLMVLEQGASVPADARVVSAQDLTISEAILTGESAPVAKSPAILSRRSVPLGDRSNMVYRGTAVTGGSGRAIVVATGPRTEMGRIQALVRDATHPDTPSQRQLASMGRQLVWLCLAGCGLVFGIGLLRGFGLLQMFRSAISLAVAAVPEGLPAISTTVLALGVEDMRRHNVLVRKLDAVETLGAVGVVCFDKTGTLTLNRMAVTEVWCDRLLRADQHGVLRDTAGARPEIGANDDALAWLLRICALCNETQRGVDGNGAPELVGSSTEKALMRTAIESGIDLDTIRLAWPRKSVRYRSELDRFMVTTHSAPNDSAGLVAVKGSPPEVLDLCGSELYEGARRRLEPARREDILRRNMDMAGRALRVLGFAFGQTALEPKSPGSARDLTWVGLAGMSDPIRPGVAGLMRSLRRAGVHPIIMTGDQVATAEAVARQLGLGMNGELHISDAAELARTDAAAVARSASRTHVFARVSPTQKLRVIRALQNAGAVVAMVGDGINDGPALKAADVGIAMGGEASETAWEVADVVLQRDDLSALMPALERGRSSHLNVRRSVGYLLGTNLSEIAVVLAGTAAGVNQPLAPTQLLWINLISDSLPGLGLAMEPPPRGLMKRGPVRVRDEIVGRQDLRSLAGDGAVIAAGSLGACLWGMLRYGASAETRTMTFGSLVIAQLLHALTCRSDQNGLFSGPGRALSGNPYLAGALAVSFGAQALAFAVPGLRSLLGLTPLGPLDLAVTLAAGALPYIFSEARKARRLDWGPTELSTPHALLGPAQAQVQPALLQQGPPPSR